MESSIDSIAAFTVQALQGIKQLHAFFKDVSLAQQRTTDLLNELLFLATTLRGIQQLITGLYEASNNSANPENAFSTVLPHLSSLESHLETCVKDVTVWVRVAKDSDPSSEKGIRAFLKKLKVAVDKSSFKEIERKIADHKVRLGFSLSVLGMWIDHAGFKRGAELSAKFNGLTDAHLKLNDSINKKIAEDQPLAESFSEIIGSQLLPLETSIEDHFDQMSSNHSESQQSIQSLSHSISSLASQVSQLLKDASLSDPTRENLPKIAEDTKTKPPESEFEWCCDAISGIDDAFDEDAHNYHCTYCSARFGVREPDSSQRRGRHLADCHAFGKCNLMITFQSWDDLKSHLIAFHTLTNEGGFPSMDRFWRKKRSVYLFRDRSFSCEHPSDELFERSTAGLIIAAGLQLAIDELKISRIPHCELPDFLQIGFSTQKSFLSTSDKIACLLEEAILSGHEDELKKIHFNENFWFYTHTSKNVEAGSASLNQSLNKWFLQILEESVALRLLLVSGKVTAAMAPATSADWLAPILAFWDIEDATTELEQKIELSDGAVDSREGLGCYSGSNVSIDHESYHPFVKVYFSRMRDLDLFSELLEEHQELRKTIEKERDKCQRLNMRVYPEWPEWQEWLELSPEREKTMAKKVEEAQASVTFLRKKCQAIGLLDKDGKPTETSSGREV